MRDCNEVWVLRGAGCSVGCERGVSHNRDESVQGANGLTGAMRGES